MSDNAKYPKFSDLKLGEISRVLGKKIPLTDLYMKVGKTSALVWRQAPNQEWQVVDKIRLRKDTQIGYTQQLQVIISAVTPQYNEEYCEEAPPLKALPIPARTAQEIEADSKLANLVRQEERKLSMSKSKNKGNKEEKKQPKNKGKKNKKDDKNQQKSPDTKPVNTKQRGGSLTSTSV